MPSYRHNYTRLIVSDMTLMMSIGIYEKEKRAPQPVEIYIEANLPQHFRFSSDSDDINHTVSYEHLVTETRRIAALRHYNLIESFAETLCEYFLKTLPIADILIRIKKPEIIEDAIVGIEVFRSRS